MTFLVVAAPCAGCGGGGGKDRATVEAGLQHYFSTFNPEDSIFPTGAGSPRVKDKGCKDLHREFPLLPPGLRLAPGSAKFTNAKKIALWQCPVRFKNFTLPVVVAVNDSNEVVWAQPELGGGRKPPKLSPARTYTG
ncbi:MAG: hypothetical protein ACJ74D_06515 [Gaiellaceae bacterium]